MGRYHCAPADLPLSEFEEKKQFMQAFNAEKAAELYVKKFYNGEDNIVRIRVRHVNAVNSISKVFEVKITGEHKVLQVD